MDEEYYYNEFKQLNDTIKRYNTIFHLDRETQLSFSNIIRKLIPQVTMQLQTKINRELGKQERSKQIDKQIKQDQEYQDVENKSDSEIQTSEPTEDREV